MNLKPFLALLVLTIANPSHAQEEVEYSPGGAKWAKVWQAFYNNEGSESELMDPLIEAGDKMTPEIIEAVSHKDMRLRRYAIGALGNIKAPAAIQPLTAILEDTSEEDYMRGDAVLAIYQIDQVIGEQLAKKYNGTGVEQPDLSSVLNMNCESILKKEPWLLESP